MQVLPLGLCSTKQTNSKDVTKFNFRYILFLGNLYISKIEEHHT